MHSIEAFPGRAGHVLQHCIYFALVASHFILRSKLGSTNLTEWMIEPPTYFYPRSPSKRKAVGNHGISFSYLHM